jgi:translation elongation factor EF-1alpha
MPPPPPLAHSVLKVGENAVVQFTPLRAVALELYKEYPALGMFVIRDLNSVVGYGQITEVEWDAPVDAI